MAITVADSNATALKFDDILDEIARLQKEKAEIERKIKEYKVPARAEMKSRGAKSYTTPNGSTASLYDTNRTNADKAEAQRRVNDPDCGMTADDLTAIFKVTTTENFKVK